MSSSATYDFGPFRLDLAAGALLRDGEEVPLTPKGFALLRHLVERPGRLLAREELLDAVWPATHVGDDVLKVRVRELRRALGDDAGAPRYIATVHRRGYRFAAEVRAPLTVAPVVEPGDVPVLGPVTSAPTGRRRELARLDEALARARAGERGIVFVSGGPGMGKTILVDSFVGRLPADAVCVARGQCLELHGPGEPYLPLLDALGRLARSRWSSALLATLRRLAPTWLAQMPSLLAADEAAGLALAASGATRERMLRELAEALEAFAVETPLVLVLEDVHWSDASTLDLLSYVARRREAARLLVVATYRADDVPDGLHPLALLPHDLATRGLAIEVPLPPLAEEDVERVVAARLGAPPPPGLARLLHRRTEGWPLFLVSALDDLLARGLAREDPAAWRVVGGSAQVELGPPAGLRALLDQRLARLAPGERRLLEAASVAGVEVSPDAVAAALGEEPEDAEERCATLARRRSFLRATVDADAAETGNYAFLHALYREAVYERVPRSRRARLHARMAEWAEDAASRGGEDRAAELAVHFERAGRPELALPYLLQAARNAARRFAGQETLLHARHALRLLAAGAAPAERDELEIELQVLRGTALGPTRGYGDPEAERAFARALELGRATGGDALTFPVLAGLWTYHLLRAELPTAAEIADALLRQAGEAPHLRAEASFRAGVTCLNRGDFAAAHDHLAAGMSAANAIDGDAGRVLFGRDVAATCASFDAWALWSLGLADGALARAAEARARARGLGDPQALAFALFFTAWVHQLRDEPSPARERAEELAALSRAEGYAQWLAFATILRGWARVGEGDLDGVEELRDGLAAYRAVGAAVSVPHFLGLLADALHRAGRLAEAREALDDALALADATGGRYYDAALLRLRGDLSADEDAAVASYRRAVDVARRQGAPLFALPAASSWLRRRPTDPRARRALDAARAAVTEAGGRPDLDWLDSDGCSTTSTPCPRPS